ncbi:cytochrome c [Marinobacter salinexigens]|uniref:Cytochrome c n=1 Tax=Marinobacter salinexigens TaxID=2919747 RepID=A0A5B0VPB0_9GAMM|nr:cytochrome c [Marinobacter salinexigens]KAA1176416.1 cytochrome c [Marinobacter salinexigens]
MVAIVKSGLGYGYASVIWTLAISFSAGAIADSRSESELANLVLQDCGSCHGMTLKGGLGPALRPENLEQRSVDAIAAIIREGVPKTAMPPWKPLLTPEEIEWISQQLKTGSLVSN